MFFECVCVEDSSDGKNGSLACSRNHLKNGNHAGIGNTISHHARMHLALLIWLKLCILWFQKKGILSQPSLAWSFQMFWIATLFSPIQHDWERRTSNPGIESVSWHLPQGITPTVPTWHWVFLPDEISLSNSDNASCFHGWRTERSLWKK